MQYIRFPFKLKQIEFDLSTKRFLLVLDEYKPNTPSRIKVYDFKTIFNCKENEEKVILALPCVADFQVILNDAKPNKIATRALWYVDN